MATDYVRLIRRIHRSANTVEVRALGCNESGLDGDTAFQEQLADLHQLVVAELRTEHDAPKRVVLDLRQLNSLSDRMTGDLVRLHRFLKAVQTQLIILVTRLPGTDILWHSKLNTVLTVVTDIAVLHREHGIELSPGETLPPEEESVTFTGEELREIEAAGVSMDDVIREIEATMPR
ncbi:MAG: hypothetical protein C0467_02315 [Planctomycetaceae bacterium]|nr:hypothetical protein [Planctomycetaceae bacterium]